MLKVGQTITLHAGGATFDVTVLEVLDGGMIRSIDVDGNIEIEEAKYLLQWAEVAKKRVASVGV